MTKECEFSMDRRRFHLQLMKALLTINSKGVPGNADGSNKTSVKIALGVAERLSAKTGERIAGQRSGHQFEDLVAGFVRDTFLKLPHLRPGKWEVRQIGNRNRSEIGRYAQYAHLDALQTIASSSLELSAALGNDYAITPDVIVVRGLEQDMEINTPGFLVDANTACLADLRGFPEKPPILHASISTKWTLRSDRAQRGVGHADDHDRRKAPERHIGSSA